jgi:hypothetical protein
MLHHLHHVQVKDHTLMHKRGGAAVPGSRALVTVAAVVVLLSLLAAPALACGGRSGDGMMPWDRQIQLKGHSRSLLSLQGRRCGAETPAPGLLATVEFQLAAYQAKEAARVATGAGAARQAKVYTIPTYVYNIVSADGADRGSVTDAGLKAQVDALNQAYATAVTPDGAVGVSGDLAGITWKFDLQSITRVKAGDMCDQAEERKIKAAQRKGPKGALNLYITDLSSCGLLGYSSWPWELDPKSGKADPVTMDGVVIHYETLPGGSYKPYNMGRTCIHETGHWMGLFHVFQNGGWGSSFGGFGMARPVETAAALTRTRRAFPHSPSPPNPQKTKPLLPARRLQQGRRPGRRHPLPERPHRGLPQVARLVPAAGGGPILELYGLHGGRGLTGLTDLTGIDLLVSLFTPAVTKNHLISPLCVQIPHPTSSTQDDKCMKGFTAGQHKRMEAMWQLHRA